ncbi:MAG: long-chain-acyl-CoA synthetase [Rhodospirillales bacterium]|nr:long-chain-acyl-CoA synthetase [Rhodospirillales bacterium]
MNAVPRASRLWLRALEAVSSIERGTELTFGGVLNDLADQYGAAPALIDDEKTLTYDALARLANLYSGWARREGFASGAVIALLMHNCADYIAIWAGLSQAGYIVALINTNLTHTALSHAVRASGAKAMIAATTLQENAASLAAECPELLMWRHGAGEGVWPRVEHALTESDDPKRPHAPITNDRTALLIYTSGTTGMPKAAKVSHARILQWSYWFAGLMDTQPGDRLYNCLPMYHSTGGVSSIGAVLVRGGSVYIRRRFSAHRFWPEIVESGSTIFQYIGELCRYLLQAPSQPLETKHQLRLCCGNGLHEKVWRRFEERFRIPRIMEFYAMTEGAVSLYNCEGRPGAIGHIPGFLAHRFTMVLARCDTETGMLVRDEAGRGMVCAAGETGEALGRLDTKSTSPARHFEGYTDTASSEAKLARDVFTTGDLWYRTGDLMRRDADGFYYFVDRLGDAFRWKGENISASEVAAIISGHPGITDAVVFGVHIPGQEGRAGMAAIAVEANFNLAALRQHIYKNLPSYARPVFIRLCPSIQRTSTFKLAAGTLAADGYSNAPLEQLLYDDRVLQDYTACTPATLTEIASGTRPV